MAARTAKPATKARGKNGNGMSAEAKAAAQAALEDLKNPDKPAIEAQQPSHFKVPGQTFVEVISILNELPFGKVAGVMQTLMSLRAEGKQQ